MRPILILLLALAVTACSKDDALTLSCNGTNIKIEEGQELISSDITKIYRFNNLKFDNYDCSTHKNIISCNFIKEENGTRERKRIIYDTTNLSFVEIIAVWATGEKVKQDNRTISRTEFIGTCQKPIKLFN
jgi:hypothetical protein